MCHQRGARDALDQQKVEGHLSNEQPDSLIIDSVVEPQPGTDPQRLADSGER